MPASNIRIGAIASTALAVTLFAAPGDPAVADARADAEATVRAFNAAFGRKDVEAVVAELIEGGVKFDLKPAHADQTEHKLVQELHEHWFAVTPIVFGAVDSYLRKVEIIDTRAAADMATVWASVTTEMTPKGAPRANTKTFTEVYFLVRTPKGWKIGAMMDDRATDRIATGAGGPAR